MTKRKKPEDKLKVGRPISYTAEIGERICELVATHTIGLPRLCAMYNDLPAQSTINRWRYQIPEFRDKYTNSKRLQSELLAEEILEIADDDAHDVKINPDTGDEYCNTEFVQRSRLRIDTRKWVAARLAPKLYGDLIGQNTENKNKEIHEEALQRKKVLDKEYEREY